ncbi:hypothetical protein [Rhodoferax sp.]
MDALLDRLQHHCITIRIEGPSLRTGAAADAPAVEQPPGPPATRRKTAQS